MVEETGTQQQRYFWDTFKKKSDLTEGSPLAGSELESCLVLCSISFMRSDVLPGAGLPALVRHFEPLLAVYPSSPGPLSSCTARRVGLATLALF